MAKILNAVMDPDLYAGIASEISNPHLATGRIMDVLDICRRPNSQQIIRGLSWLCGVIEAQGHTLPTKNLNMGLLLSHFDGVNHTVKEEPEFNGDIHRDPVIIKRFIAVVFSGLHHNPSTRLVTALGDSQHTLATIQDIGQTTDNYFTRGQNGDVGCLLPPSRQPSEEISFCNLRYAPIGGVVELGPLDWHFVERPPEGVRLAMAIDVVKQQP